MICVEVPCTSTYLLADRTQNLLQAHPTSWMIIYEKETSVTVATSPFRMTGKWIDRDEHQITSVDVLFLELLSWDRYLHCLLMLALAAANDLAVAGKHGSFRACAESWLLEDIPRSR